ncbi:sacsin-like [Montipora capricornis]|uniref:sacsin-like n=1 Tax=Montipora capricornis TaxID=246305 RepID=UPI0035F14D50
MQSSKKDDPLKVGRFGIGFNSVYHVTDLPSIVSGDAIAFLDPHEIHFGKNETGEQFSLRDQPLQKCKDQFLPYEDVLDCKISTQFYNGTLFRFPLRTEPSDLSKKNYTPEKVRQLFDALKKESSVILLFLKNIEEISLFETDGSNIQKHVFTVKLTDRCRSQVHEEKKSLLTQIKRLSEGRITNTRLSLTLNIDEVEKNGKAVSRKWLVHHEIDAQDSSLRQLSSELGLLPWIGIAAPLDPSERQALSSTGGRIFCFLPLPPDADAKTGFPVHVHGYFGLTDNRRGLKWPGLDCQNDNTAEWNVRLSERVGSQAYASMLLYLIEKHTREPGDPSSNAKLVYLSWPSVQEVQSQWKGVLNPMFSILVNKNVFWTPSAGGKWSRPQDVLLDRMTDSSEIKTAVIETLIQANEEVVTLPNHVLKAIDSMSWSTRSITPAYVRNLLKQEQKGSWNIKNVSKEKKLCLLQYVLIDKNLQEMQGVPLLPLASGGFVKFRPLQYSREPQAAVCVLSARYSRSLFPNMESKFLDDSIHSPAVQYLSNAAFDLKNRNAMLPIQLMKINPDIALNLVRQMLPTEWSGSSHLVYWYPGQNGHPPENWLASAWRWIQNDFSGNLSPVEELPLIPHTTSGQRAIVKLRTSSLAIRDHDQGVSLPRQIVSLLRKLGCIVLENIPSYVNHHTLHKYIASPNPYGVLKVLQVVGQSTCVLNISTNCSSEEKRALRGFLSSTVLSCDQQSLLLGLPIFDAVDGKCFLAVKNGFQSRTIAPFGFELPTNLPIPNASGIISVKDMQSNDLLQRLGVQPMNPKDFLTTVVFNGISSGFYNHRQVSTLMCWVLRQYNYMQSHAILESLRNLRFVITQSNTLVTPCEILDPQKSILQRLFEGNNSKFPHDDFVKEDILQGLRKLGMRSSPNTQDILQVAQTLENVVDGVASRRALALLEFLDQNPYILHSDKTLLQGLMAKRWVRRKEDRPPSYPRMMPWFEDRARFYSPREIVSQSKANIVGATMPLVWKSCSETLEAAFGWNNGPPVHHLISQLRSACSTPLEAMSTKEKHWFEDMLKDIYQELSKSVEDATKMITGDSSFPALIWHGSGFTFPHKIAFSCSCNINFIPYLYVIPGDFVTFRAFFERCGVRITFNDSDFLDVLVMIKEKHDAGGGTRDVTADQKLSHDILHWIVRGEEPLGPELRQRLLVPVMTWDKTLKLVLCNECTFCDASWLRKGGHELPVTNQYPMIHDTISPKIASLLGVPPISTRISCAEALGIEQTGPHEPVTTRLKNILNEYKEGVGVFRELVQNADDAGATEVQFVLDWRSHPTEKLLAPGMADCQGPALLVYNNAVFSDEDLVNISKLAGATKREDLEKIGRFGLGFSSVYHFTDVPSFISRSYAVFFDPHTSHLQAQIQSPSKPGIKLNFSVNPSNLLYFSDQFAPFNGLFGCNITLPNVSEEFFFQGTLFRFAFRTKRGEISDKIYSKEEIHNLARSFQESSPSLLLFTQNVRKVTFSEISKNSVGHETSQVLFEVAKDTVSVHQSGKKSEKEPTFLESCAKWTKAAIEQNGTTTPPKRSEIVTISSTMNCKSGTKRHEEGTWLVTSSLGTGRSFTLATSEEGKKQGLLSASGIAGKISSRSDDKAVSKPAVVRGELFCFLPLSIPTGLPVHVNGYFAVTSNRRGIWESTTAETGRFQPLEVRWNRNLMDDALSQAYIQLLEEMVLMQQKGKIALYRSFLLWPNPETLESTAWKALINSVYQKIADSNLPLVNMGGKWLPIIHCIFQDAKLQKIPNSETVLSMYDYKVVQLPEFAKKGFKQARCDEIIQKRTMTPEMFLKQVFFPNIMNIPGNLRDRIVCYLMDHCLRVHSSLQEDPSGKLYVSLLTSNSCIPCSPDDEDLACPKELISPNGAAAPLFTPEDKRFPVGTCYHTQERLLMLQKLGMKTDILDWDSLLERANTVQEIYRLKGEEAARKRVKCIVEYFNDHLHNLGDRSAEIIAELRNTSLFPVLKKPENYTMKWRGSDDHGKEVNMLPAEDLYGEEYKFVAGSSSPVLDDSESLGCGRLNEETRNLFGFDVRKPTVDEVLFQLDQAIDSTVHSPSEVQCLQRVCEDIYSYLQDLLPIPVGENIIEELAKRSWILIQGKFVSSSCVAFTWTGIGEPFLYEVPRAFAENYPRLFRATRVRDYFNTEDFIATLYRLIKAKQGRPLGEDEFKVTKCLIEELLDAPDDVLQEENGMIPLPDDGLVMRAARDLSINDAPWVSSQVDTRYVHKHVPIDLAHKMGAVDIRSRKLAKISRPIGQEFGQREELTDRLKGILKSYPCDVGILKELVQNADDAGATEIHFIYDPRTHPTNRLLSENWKELQGPALCVYNDKPFSEKDLEGIQRLGIGSKTDDPTKTGQYGIGFNSVYHLTDCPSFISNGDTLCILDPHCRYAPGATKESPGRLIAPIGEEERSDYRDIFPCYLEDHFDLSMSTMFRLPLRNNNLSMTSLISDEQVSYEQITRFMNLFTIEAKEILLFLNHLTKITLSKIEEGKLKQLYSVSAEISEADFERRKQLSDHLKRSKTFQTNEIEWFGITYPLLIQDTRTREKWLIHQCIGLKPGDTTEEVPNGRPYGLLPRGGIAAKVFEQSSVKSSVVFESQHKAYCFLPLPLNTGLPVHVNGHFYLDSARRNLWHDANNEGFGCQWNNFLKTKVLAEAYVSLLLTAREFVPGSEIAVEDRFSKTYQISERLRWYHGLFPHLASVDNHWAILASSLFCAICRQDESLLPLVKKVTVKVPGTRTEGVESKESNRCFWLPPSQGFFNTMSVISVSDKERCEILLRIGFKLLYSSQRLFEDFKKAGTSVRQITPEAVIQFLKEGSANIGTLPCPVQETELRSAVGVLIMLSYCMKSPKFAASMFGLPLLLTEDGFLRRFQEANTVFLTRFFDLVPTKSSLFIHHTLVSPLLDIEKEILSTNQRVLRKFDIPALASLLPDSGSDSWYETNNLIPWDEKKGPSKRWLQLLWEFISKVHGKDPNNFSLNPLGQWPVIPTSSGFLSPVSKSKVILDLTSSQTWSPGQRNVVELLRKLECHEVDAKLISRDGKWDVSPILRSCLSYSNSSQDVLKVLDHLMKQESISGKLSEDEMISILQFLQEDVSSIKANVTSSSTMKRLPFFKTFRGNFVSLENVPSIYVVPTGLPNEESEVWMTGNECVFLAPQPKLDNLYREVLGAGNRTHLDCYLDFIFPKFPDLNQTTRMLHLEYVRRVLLPFCFDKIQRSRVISSLRTLAFIPDTSGIPRMASYFYDPGVKVFAVMLPPASKPPKPFTEDSGWLDLLREIGLKGEVSKDQFKTFANNVATQAEHVNKSSRPGLEKKSKVLVKHLFTDTSLHHENYLSDLSTIKFLASQKATDELIHLHKQHLVDSGNQDQLPPFVQFKDSVPHGYERLVWTSASLLPSWATPESPKLAMLQFLKKPSLDQVVENIKNISRNVSKRADREQPEPKRRLLKQIMIEVYTFLTEMSNCPSNDSLESKQTCETIQSLLSSVACILVEDGRIFVRCDQLAYRLEEELPPYLYRVPREYGQFEHLLKRLGAMENATPAQFAKLLSRLKESIGEEKMHVNELTAAKQAVYGLFYTLHALNDKAKDEETSCEDNPLAEFRTLYLPSREQRLHYSSELVLFHCPRYKYRIARNTYNFFDPLSKELTFATPEQLVDLLPVHLRPKMLASLVREELHEECKDKKCRADIEGKCQATERLRQVVFSPQLVDGILRILKYQWQRAKLTDEVRDKVRSFQKELGMSCMEVLSTELIENESDTPIPDSKRSKGVECFVGKENGMKHIFIKHGVETSNISRVLCREINQLTGCYIAEVSWLHLSAILECKNPQEIPSKLDSAGVAEDIDADASQELEPELGTEYPEELQDLLVQFDDFYFRRGEYVAYETEDSTDEEPKYIYAKILYRLQTPQPAKQKKDRKKRKQKGESKYLSRYMIDIGNQKKEVDVLDLYKIKRPQKDSEQENATEDEPVSESVQLVPYEGKDGENGKTKAGPSTASSQGATAEPPKPTTLEKAFEEVRKALAEIWKLPEDKRKKAVRRLYLRWHPDKNMDMQDVANEVMKFIQNEVDRRSKGGSAAGHRQDFNRGRPDFSDFSDFFTRWNQRARRQRSSYENFRRHNTRFTGFASSSRRRYQAPNTRLAKIWMSQSREDLRSVKHLLTARDPLYYLVCFQCHQVAEKALKASLYALSGVADSQLCSHDLGKLACDLSQLPGAPDLTSVVARLSTYYDETRYPNSHVPARAPKDAFQDSQQAQEAFRLAADLLTRLESLGL